METKNLSLKFGLLSLLIAVCLGSLFFGNGLTEGIDLRGGHSLTFQIQSDDAKVKDLQDQKVALEQKLAAATSDDQKNSLQDKLDEVTAEIDRLERTSGAGGNLGPEMAQTIKNRVDPTGLLAWEIRPVGKNRIQIRMPIASSAAKEAGDAYRKALETLGDGNITRAIIRRMATANPQRQGELVERHSFGDPAAGERLRRVIEAQQAVTDAQKALDAAKKSARPQAENNLDNALVAYEALVRKVLVQNINPIQLQNLLRSYVPPREEDQLRKQPDGAEELRKRQKQLDDDLAALKEKYGARWGQIEQAITLYRSWADLRHGLLDPFTLKRILRKVGVLEFRIAPSIPETGRTENIITIPERQRYLRLLQETGPSEVLRRNMPYVWLAIHDADERFPGLVVAEYAGQRYLLLHNRPGYVMLHDRGERGWELEGASEGRGESNEPVVDFELDPRGARQMLDLTSSHMNQQMAIVLDDEVYSAPSIRGRISNKGQITTGGNPQEVADLIKTLRAGSLPAKLDPNPVRENTFGPGIGRIDKQLGIRAAVWSLIAVAAFMMVYYLLAGAIANFALMLNIVLILGGMSIFGAVFTLPGIAGVILTIGIAVDANVLIFERLREEQTKGQSPALTIKNAYSRAFSAIFDANVTTLITCLILGWIGTEEVRGFAVTLGLGVVASMFTALVVTRWVFQLLLNTNLIRGHLKMISLVGVPSINWMAKRHFFWAVSTVMVVMGIASLFWQRSNVMGIEFSSGTEAIIRLKNDATLEGADGQAVLPNDAVVRDRFIAQAATLGKQGALIAATARVEELQDPEAIAAFLEEYDADSDTIVTTDEWQKAKANPAFFAALDTEKAGALTRNKLAKRLPPRMFQVSTTEIDPKRIRDVASAAFGPALQRRIPIRGARLVTGRAVEAFGVTTAEDGLTRVAPNPLSSYRDLLEDFDSGVIFVIENIDPPVSDGELRARIREMRDQPEFEDQRANPTEVVGLTPSGNGYSAFAVLVRALDPLTVDKTDDWERFAAIEKEIVLDSLEREESMVMTNFDPAIAGEARGRAIMAIVLSWLAIVAYLWLRFGSIQWGLAAVICLIHDVLIVVGLVAASGWLVNTTIGQWLGISSFKIDLPMVAAFLTVIGYSVNDTIVVFDRIRENRGKLTAISPAIINRSINQTLARTLLTSGTTLIVVVIMYVWGGRSTIHSFSFALIVGVLFGTYSSVAIASPLLMGFKKALVARTAGINATDEKRDAS